MIADILLAFGLVLENATQLHVPGTPLGVGEALIVLWLGLALASRTLGFALRRTAGRPANMSSKALNQLLAFWTIFAFAQSVGSIVGMTSETFRDTSSAIRTSIAYVVMALATCCLLTMPQAWTRLRRILWISVGFGAVSLLLILAAAFGLAPRAGIEPWAWNRLRGWSENPNQLAFLCMALMLLAFHLAETAKSAMEEVTAMVCVVPPFLSGVLTKSDSFILFALSAIPLIVLAKLYSGLLASYEPPTFRRAVASILVLSLPAFAVSVTPFAPKLIDTAQKFASDTMQQNNQAEKRFDLWEEAIDIGLRAHMLGLGPGPHLAKKQWKRPPPDKFEAHNTLLDLFTQGGLIAVGAFMWILATAFFVAVRAGFASLSMLAFSVFLFSNFHFNGRQLLLWFTVAVCLAAGETVRRSSARRLPEGPDWLSGRNRRSGALPAHSNPHA